MIYFNPLNNTLLDRNKNVLKKLECIFESILKEETYKESKGINPCIMCKNNVINTSIIHENELFELIQNNPNTCLKIDINQINIIIDTNATLDR
jgi:hypothetical protein